MSIDVIEDMGNVKRNIVVKVGSQLLTNGKGKINYNYLNKICSDIAELMRLGHNVIFVRSGAIASCPHDEWPKNLQAPWGDTELAHYIKDVFMKRFGIECVSILVLNLACLLSILLILF